MKPSDYLKWGTPAIHWYQLADGCFLDVRTSSTSVFQVQAEVEDPYSTVGIGATGQKNLPSGAIEYTWPDLAGNCERAISLTGAAIDITTQQLEGHSSAASRCAAAGQMVKELLVTDTHRLPRRPLASPTVTRFDLCNLIDISGVDRLPGFAGSYPDVVRSGGQCVLDRKDLHLDIRFAFIDASGLPGSLRTVGGHRLSVEQFSAEDACDVITVQGDTRTQHVSEIIELVLFQDGHTRTLAQLCATASTSMVDILNEAGLR